MHVKLESKSSRVKGLSFHPKRPWLLASLHNGTIQLWDYSIKTVLDRFEGHEGPVRSVNFHHSQPIFCSGGDDAKVRLWNIPERRMLAALSGHMDYIRCVTFHHTSPWILSASDDQCLRIWNWQSRTCISIISGHNHYVMAALWHPREDLIISASLDQTIRVWDISALKRKTSVGPSAHQNDAPELFGGSDALPRFILEGHERGVNTIALHPTKPLLVSGSDDRSLKLWRLSDTKAWEVETIRGHYNNVSSVLFHPRNEALLSNSEDKTLRLWDLSRKVSPTILARREGERFWALASHPAGIPLFAAGHDGGFILFKLERERPAFCLSEEKLFFVRRNKELVLFNCKTNSEQIVASLDNGSAVRQLTYSKEDAALVLVYDNTFSFEIVSLAGASLKITNGNGRDVAWLGSSRFAVLRAAEKKISMYNLKDGSERQCDTLNAMAPVNLWQAFPRHVLVGVSAEPSYNVILYDAQHDTIVSTVSLPFPIKRAVYNSDFSFLALLGKTGIAIVLGKSLEMVCTINEPSIKGGVWDNSLGGKSQYLIYNTPSQVKYLIPNASHETGLIKSGLVTNCSVYLAGLILPSSLVLIDGECKQSLVAVDLNEARFKALLSDATRIPEAFSLLGSSNLVGQSIIAYLRNKGFPEIALQFVKDPISRFELAIQTGQLDVAMEVCNSRNADDSATHELLQKLSSEALLHGNLQLAETCFIKLQKAGISTKLPLLLLSSGQLGKLAKLSKISAGTGDLSACMSMTLLGNEQNTFSTLLQDHSEQLAFLHAKSNGNEELANNIITNFVKSGNLSEEKAHELVAMKTQHNTKLNTPQSLLNEPSQFWPLTGAIKDSLQLALEKAQRLQSESETLISSSKCPKPSGASEKEESKNIETSPVVSETSSDKNNWAVDQMEPVPVALNDTSKAQNIATNEWASLDDEELNFDEFNGFDTKDHPVSALELIIAGEFEKAKEMLRSSFGIVIFEPLLPFFHQYQTNSNFFTVDVLKSLRDQAMTSMTEGKFADAKVTLEQLLYSSLFVTVQPQNGIFLQELKQIAREYLLGLLLESTRRSLPPSELKRSVELACYFANTRLLPIHSLLTVRSAMTLSFKCKCYATALIFAKRLLELNPDPNTANQAKKLISMCENNSKNAFDINYNPTNMSDICAVSLTPVDSFIDQIYTCSFCGSLSKQEEVDKSKRHICNVCKISDLTI